MAHNYDPTPLYHATYPVPDDGDPAIAASVNSPMEDLADGLAYGVEPMALGGTIALGGELEFAGSAVVFAEGATVSGGQFIVGVDATLTEDVTLGSSAADTITIGGTLLVTGNAQIGNASSDALSVRSATTFNASVDFISPVTAYNAFTIDADGAFTCEGPATLTGTVQIGDASTDSLEVYSSVLFRSTVEIGNDTGPEGFTVNAPTIFHDTVELNGTVQLDGDININGDVICGGTITATNDCTFGNGASDAIRLLGSTTITNIVAPVGFSSDGRILMRITTGPNATSSIDLDAQDVLHVPTLTTDRTYNVSFAGAVDGSWCWIVKDSGTAGDLEINWVGGTSTFLAAQHAAILFMLHDGAIITLPRI